jgi:hypothetical protein
MRNSGYHRLKLMTKIRSLIDKSIESLNDNKSSIYDRIERIVNDSRNIASANYFVFEIDHLWYNIDFYARRSEFDHLSHIDLKLPEFVTNVLTDAWGIQDSENDIGDLWEEVNSYLIDTIAECWNRSGGNELAPPTYIYFNYSCFQSYFYYWDLRQGKRLDEEEYERLIELYNSQLI